MRLGDFLFIQFCRKNYYKTNLRFWFKTSTINKMSIGAIEKVGFLLVINAVCARRLLPKKIYNCTSRVTFVSDENLVRTVPNRYRWENNDRFVIRFDRSPVK